MSARSSAADVVPAAAAADLPFVVHVGVAGVGHPGRTGGGADREDGEDLGDPRWLLDGHGRVRAWR
jgi:hypothetical protein